MSSTTPPDEPVEDTKPTFRLRRKTPAKPVIAAAEPVPTALPQVSNTIHIDYAHNETDIGAIGTIVSNMQAMSEASARSSRASGMFATLARTFGASGYASGGYTGDGTNRPDERYRSLDNAAVASEVASRIVGSHGITATPISLTSSAEAARVSYRDLVAETGMRLATGGSQPRGPVPVAPGPIYEAIVASCTGTIRGVDCIEADTPYGRRLNFDDTNHPDVRRLFLEMASSISSECRDYTPAMITEVTIRRTTMFLTVLRVPVYLTVFSHNHARLSDRHYGWALASLPRRQGGPELVRRGIARNYDAERLARELPSIVAHEMLIGGSDTLWLGDF